MNLAELIGMLEKNYINLFIYSTSDTYMGSYDPKVFDF